MNHEVSPRNGMERRGAEVEMRRGAARRDAFVALCVFGATLAESYHNLEAVSDRAENVNSARDGMAMIGIDRLAAGRTGRNTFCGRVAVTGGRRG